MEESQLHIPEGWESCQLGKLANFTTGKKDVNEVSSEGQYPFYTCSKRVLKSNIYSYDNEALMVAGNGDVGTVHYYKGKFEAYQRTYVLSNFKIDVQYLFQYLKSNLVKHLTEGQSGTTIQFIKINQLTDFEILKPKSITEQTTIASILSKTDQAIAHTEALIAKYTRIKTGLMQDLLTKGIDQNGNIRTEQTHKFKDSPLGRIPNEWEVLPINKFCELIVDCKNRTSPFVDKGDYPVIRTSNVKNGGLVWEDMKYTDYDSYKIWTQRAIPKSGDVIITREAPLGQTLKIPIGMTPVLGQRTMLYRVDSEKLLADYLVYLVMDERMQKYLNSISGGSTVHHLKVGEMREFLIAVSSTIAEQNSILDLLTNTQNNIDELKEKTLKLQSLKTGLMQDLLTGKVRVII